MIQTFDYDGAARIQRVTTTNTGAYTRYNYGATFVERYSTVNNVADEGYAMTVYDGLGQVIATGGNNPGSTGGYSAQVMFHDIMGRVAQKSNPTETTGVGPSWPPAGDDDPSNGGTGYAYTSQTYDWKGRPLVTTNTDGNHQSASYGGCGCAGGQVATLTDEV